MMKNIFTKTKYSFKNGFSLVETLVAITILVLAITGPLTVAYQSLSNSKNIKNQTTAIFLAQDAMEFMKNLRDSNALAGNAWLITIGTCSTECTVDTTDGSISTPPCGSSCPVLKFDSATGLYGHDPSWVDTRFRRTVMVESISGNEALITVNITWGSGVQAKSLIVTDNIFDWHE